MALKDKLMTLEDFKAVRDVDVASNSAQFTEIKADLDDNVNDLKSAIYQSIGLIAITASKYFDVDGKTAVTSNRRMINTFPVAVASFGEISITNPYSMYWYALDENMTLLSNSGKWVKTINITSLPVGCFYINFTIRNDNTQSSDISSQVDIVTKSINTVPSYDLQITKLNESIRPINGEILVEMEQGAFDSHGFPLDTGATTRLRSKGFIEVAHLYNLIVTLTSNTELSYDVIPIYYADNTGKTAQIGREIAWANSPASIIVPYENAKYVKLYVKNSDGTTIIPSDVDITVSCVKSELDINYYSPTVSQTKMYAVQSRINGQDIAVYNGNILDFGIGKVSVNGGENISIENGHGNNCCFGDVLHGDFPYLYCAPWNGNENNIYVNQYTDGTFTLVNTITYPSISGILNACVDEANNRVYMFNVVSTAEVGSANFVVADLDGNVISTKQIEPIPVIEGITFYNGVILVSSGHGVGYPNYIHVFDTEGNLLSKTQANAINIKWNNADVIEGIDIDKATGILYIGTTKLIVRN